MKRSDWIQQINRRKEHTLTIVASANDPLSMTILRAIAKTNQVNHLVLTHARAIFFPQSVLYILEIDYCGRREERRT